MSISKLDIEEFLNEFGFMMKGFDVFFQEDSQTNIQKLLDLDITIKERRQLIENLSINDYVKGPIGASHNGDNQVWKFRKKCNAVKIPIQISVNKKESEIYIAFN